MHQGHDAAKVVALCSGVVKLVRGLRDGKEALVGIRVRGAILGAGAALLGVAEPLSVTTLSHCEVIEIPASQFSSLVRRGGALSWWMHLEHCQELERELTQISELACLSARERLTHFMELIGGLVEPTHHGGGQALVVIPLKDWELAQLIAVTPQYVCQLMHELEREGRLIRQGRQCLYASSGPLVTSLADGINMPSSPS